MSELRSIAHCGFVAMALVLLVCPALCRLAAQAASATPPPPAPPPRFAPTPEQLAIRAASEKDHQRLMDLLGIKELRPGASHDPKSPYAVNYDESKANVYPSPGDMPVDSHELIALCAPRPVFIGAGASVGDGWADARGMFLAESASGPVYRLLGKQDLGTTAFPPIETGLVDGDLGFRQHSGGHTPSPNWPTFLDFASRYLHAPAAIKTASTEGSNMR